MNFETFIKQAMAAGVSPETLASDFTAALNKVQESNKSKKEREDYLQKMRARAKAAIDQDKFNLDAAAAIAVVDAGKRFPKWTLKELQTYYESIAPSLEMGINVIDDAMAGASPTEVAKNFLSKWTNGLNNTNRTFIQSRRDKDILKEFLNTI